MPLTLTEQLAHSTVRIEVDYAGGESGCGTGFVYQVRPTADPADVVTLLITNKHVVEGSIRGRLRFTCSNAESMPNYKLSHTFQIDDFAPHWAAHSNPTIDLCALPLAGYVMQMNALGLTPFFCTVDRCGRCTQQELDDMSAVEPILMVGYPNGLWDEANNLPLIRKGTTATHPARAYNDRPEFVIDAACFPGSSGSPVFLFNELGYDSRSEGRVIGISRVKLLGILYAGPTLSTCGEIVTEIVPTASQPFARMRLMMNLGYVIRADQLDEFDLGYSEIVLARASQNEAAAGTTSQ